MRLIDADTLIGAIRHDAFQTSDSHWGYGLNHAVAIVRSQPAVDAVPVVRCKDCKWWHESETHKGYGDCGQANGITLKSSDWFCADGERKKYKEYDPEWLI